MSDNLKGILSACVTAILWGFLAVLMKVALAYVGPVEVAWFRFTLAAGILLFYFIIVKPKLLSIVRAFPIILFIAAVCLGFNYIGYIYGLHYTGPSTAQIVIQIGPILLALSGILFFKEKVNKWQLTGFAIAIIGLLLFYNNQLSHFVEVESFNKGFLWTGFAAVSWTVYAILQKKLVAKYDPQLLNLFIYGIPAIMLMPATDFNEFNDLANWQWILLVFLGLNTLFAYGFLALAFKYTQAYKVSIIIILNPIITLVIMTIIYHTSITWIEGEQLSLVSAFGALLLLTGAVISVFFSYKNKAKLN
ncbi:EamA domain-containing membrane protein RarD [Balneicella halophila]|uniref:EamA domain-containing membrane protein RarD n=1 Tax=Balneicella halophila TaxID=1537566 RepID=A0A7L4UMK1_BALHA|nr:DMT family transporter [Balneicella halophila]PVX49846.1 EamA domain-containing membrane protein RarD [Balneicella halophila]